MPSPKAALDKINAILNAWENLAPNDSFGGMTLEEFSDAIEASLSARDRIGQLEAELAAAKNARDTSDRESMAKVQLVVNGVIGDPTHGPDGNLYEAMGYVRRSERKSGLTRRNAAVAGV